MKPAKLCRRMALLPHIRRRSICAFKREPCGWKCTGWSPCFRESEKGRFTKQTMTDALRHTQEAEIGGVRFPMLSGAYQIIALLAHMEQHLATSGIGLRQVCDWAVTAHALRNCFDGETLALLERCGLLRFARIMTRLCERYLGLPPCPWTADASDALVAAMLSDVLEGGNFQAQYAKRPLADVLTDAL